MRARSLAQQIVHSLNRRPIAAAKDDLLPMYEENDADSAFKRIHRLMVVHSPHSWFGWNKLWRGKVLYGWYGSIVTVQPLRIVALELSGERGVHPFLQQLISLQATGAPFDEGAGSCSDDRASANMDAPLRVTAELGGDRQPLPLLQRLNLDLRERPFIERWRWSDGNGWALLSDEGRVQITRELVWARTIESALLPNGYLPLAVRELLTTIESESCEVLVNDSARNCREVERMVEKLEWYGLARCWREGWKLRVPAGEFPQQAVQWWGDAGD